VLKYLESQGIPHGILGITSGESLAFCGGERISLKKLAEINEDWLPCYMEGHGK
jgi:hypothetical protein